MLWGGEEIVSIGGDVNRGAPNAKAERLEPIPDRPKVNRLALRLIVVRVTSSASRPIRTDVTAMRNAIMDKGKGVRINDTAVRQFEIDSVSAGERADPRRKQGETSQKNIGFVAYLARNFTTRSHPRR